MVWRRGHGREPTGRQRPKAVSRQVENGGGGVQRDQVGEARDIVAVDFFLVPTPTLTFRLLFVLVVLRHDRRELLHLNVTEQPTAVWTARQILDQDAVFVAPYRWGPGFNRGRRV
jgi:hypothetical protein